MSPPLPAGCATDQQLAAFLAREVTAIQADALQTHLAGCEDCAARLSGLPSIAAGGDDATLPTLPEAARRRPAVRAPSPAAEPVKAADPAVPLERGASIGRYLITGRLGEGGMGVVYAAYDPDLGRRVAIKVLRAQTGEHTSASDGQARLLREAQAMARVSHPNVIAVHDVGVLGGAVFVAMELVDGSTLRKWLKDSPRSQKEILDAFVKSGRGLAAAHAAGMVHRDFKPENVLIGKDGRVRVTDFGLARVVASEGERPAPLTDSAIFDEEGSGTLPRADVQLTRAGLVMGTPAYMSPEQFAGAATDARSDQFSFCAALYFALFKKRPFKPSELASHAAELDYDKPTRPVRVTQSRTSGMRRSRTGSGVTGVIAEPPRDAKVPAHLRRAVMRGLAVDRDERFESMDALLSELTRDPAQVRKRWLATAAACVLVGSAVGVYQRVTSSRELLCSGGPQRLTGVWDLPAKDALRAAFLATGSTFAETAADRTLAVLDGYASEWTAMHREACEATQLRGEQTEQVLSLRMACLDRRLADLSALGRVLADADRKTVEKAIGAAQALTPLRSCADVEALLNQTQLPEDPKQREAIAKVEGALSEVKALLDAGKLKPGLQKATAAANAADAVAFKPVQAEALHLLGWLQAVLGDPQEGERALTEAIFAGQAGRNDEMVIRASAKLVYVDCCMRRALPDALRWSKLAEATLERIGGNEVLQSELLANVGAAYAMSGRRAEAVSSYEQALKLTDRAASEDTSRRAIMLSNLGTLYADGRQFDRAVKTLGDAIGLIERTRGPEHVSVAHAHDSMAGALRGLGKYGEAHQHADRAIALFKKALGEEHATLAAALDTQGSIYLEESALAAALHEFGAALEMKEKSLGADHPDLVASLDGMGRTLLRQKKPAQALPLLERALALRSADPAKLASVQFALAQALVATRGDRGRSRQLAEAAKQTFVANTDTLEAAKVDAWLTGAGL